MVKINIPNKLAYTLIAFAFLALVAISVSAYGGSSPSVMGHSLGELQGVQARVTGTCNPLSAIRVINADGTVTCESGLQTKITTGATACLGANLAIKTIDPNTGAITCETDDIGAGGLTGFGTANYLTKFTGATSVGSSIIYEDSINSRIGIGTTSPADVLEVNPNGNLNGGISIKGTSSSFGDIGLKIHNTGIGGIRWFIDSTGAASGYGVGKLAFVAGEGGTVVQTLDSANGGRVGIGTTIPAEKLDVAGNIKSSGNVQASGSLAAWGDIVTTTGNIVTTTGNVQGPQLCIGADCRSSWPFGVQCPPRRIMVDESSPGQNEWAQYFSCTPTPTSLTLQYPKICDELGDGSASCQDVSGSVTANDVCKEYGLVGLQATPLTLGYSVNTCKKSGTNPDQWVCSISSTLIMDHVTCGVGTVSFNSP